MIPLFVISILLFHPIHSQTVVKPHFSCWFTTYENQSRTKNIVFGYNNTGNSDILLPFTSGSNTLQPDMYNGQQKDIFKIGYNAFEFVLSDSQHLGGTINWRVNEYTVVVNLDTDLNDDNQCNRLYHDSCAVLIEHFCEDSSYCNGEETCFSTAMFGKQTPNVLGVCSPASSQAIDCPLNTPCNESTLSCYESPRPVTTVPTEAPTEAPTKNPTLSINPVFECWYHAVDENIVTGSEPDIIKYLVFGYNNTADEIQMIPVTRDPYTVTLEKNILSIYNGRQPILFLPGYHQRAFIIADTNRTMDGDGGRIDWFLTDKNAVITKLYDLIPERLCNAPPTPIFKTQCTVNNTDCSRYHSFCHGSSICNTETRQCVHQDAVYSPCPSIKQQEGEEDLPIEMACIEHLSQCAQFVFCQSDSQCNDGYLCNGPEYCAGGLCVYQNDTSVEAICGPGNFTCIEGRGCVSSGYSISNGTITVIVMLIAFFIAFLAGGLVLFYYYYETKKNSDRKED